MSEPEYHPEVEKWLLEQFGANYGHVADLARGLKEGSGFSRSITREHLSVSVTEIVHQALKRTKLMLFHKQGVEFCQDLEKECLEILLGFAEDEDASHTDLGSCEGSLESKIRQLATKNALKMGSLKQHDLALGVLRDLGTLLILLRVSA